MTPPESTPALRARIRHLERLCEGVATAAQRAELDRAREELGRREAAERMAARGRLGAGGRAALIVAGHSVVCAEFGETAGCAICGERAGEVAVTTGRANEDEEWWS